MVPEANGDKEGKLFFFNRFYVIDFNGIFRDSIPLLANSHYCMKKHQTHRKNVRLN